jgi:hypothetical protein
MIVVAFAAFVAFAGHKLLTLFGVTIPDLGPLKPSHIFGLAGLILGLSGFFLLGRK